jgi:hypothetical protein
VAFLMGENMHNIPARWRKYLYGVSAAAIPVLVIIGWVSDEVAPALLGLANAVFIGGLAFANTDTDPWEVMFTDEDNA